ncbi:MAG: DUF4136 domain-containing protein [Candidatus Zixiibacteriota bacterium]|nr:MAG: DUF4136 domain-containing protein [candidate division Zixibacteria bacterium]
MRRMYCLMVTGVVLVLLGCGSPRVETEYNRQHDFSVFRTFDFMPEDEELAKSIPLGWRLLQDSIRESVAVQMESRGFRVAGEEQPDLLVAVHVIAPQRVRRKSDRNDYKVDFFWETEYQGRWLSSHSFKEGTLVLDMVDPGTNRLVWRGWAARVIDDPQDAKGKFEEAVQSLLARFPPE